MKFPKFDSYTKRALIALIIAVLMSCFTVFYYVHFVSRSSQKTAVTPTESSQTSKSNPAPSIPKPAPSDTKNLATILAPQSKTPSSGSSSSPSTKPNTNPTAVLGATSNIPIPATGAYWGTYRDSQGYLGGSTLALRKQVMTDGESAAGRKFDYDRQFYKWGDTIITNGAITATPSNYAEWSSDQGHYLHINLVSTNRSSGFTSWASIANGSQDAYIHALASSFKNWGKPAFFTFHHEPESKICPNDTATGCDTATYYGTTTDYKNAWRHIVTTFRSDGVNNLSYAWLTGFYRWSYPADYKYGANNYPGDDVIDWIGVDPFNFIVPFNTTANYSNWKELSTLINPWYAWSSSHNKPLMLGAWGVIEDPSQASRRATWLNTARSDLKTSFTKIKALLTYDAYPPDNLSDTRIYNGTSATIAAYNAFGLDAYFNTRNCNVSNCPGYSPTTDTGSSGSDATSVTGTASQTASNAAVEITKDKTSDSVSSKNTAEQQSDATLRSAQLARSTSNNSNTKRRNTLNFTIFTVSTLISLFGFGYGIVQILAKNGHTITFYELRTKIRSLVKSVTVN